MKRRDASRHACRVRSAGTRPLPDRHRAYAVANDREDTGLGIPRTYKNRGWRLDRRELWRSRHPSAFWQIAIKGGAGEIEAARSGSDFATWILLGLEFALAADLVRTALPPTWEDISKLA